MNTNHLSVRTMFARFFARALPTLLILMLVFTLLPMGVQDAQAVLFNCEAVTDVPFAECEALVTLYVNTNGTTWTDHTNWMASTTVDDWYGVTVLDGHVSKLQLGWNNLSGSIPADIQYLPNLVDLTLTHNTIGGSLPAELGNLSNLVFLNLDNNQFSGEIPAALGSLSKLTYLVLAANSLTGSIPSSLGNLNSLTRLYLYANQLSGLIPSTLGNLTNLVHFRLSNNHLIGPIPPELSQLANLDYLYVDENSLSGTIPPELGSMTTLWGLYLNDNQLSGVIPAELGNMTSLLYLELANNGFGGPIPEELANLSNLTSLRLDNNEFTGLVPSALGTLPNLDSLRLDNTFLIGSLPLSFTSNTSMYHVSFADTSICEPDLPEYTAWKATVTEYIGTGIACELNPVIDQKLTSSKVTFAWEAPISASKYKIQLSTKEDFSTLVFSAGSPTNSYEYLTSLVNGTTYYWRIKALFDTTWSIWFPTYQFYSMDPLTAPVLENPPDTDLLYPNFTLSWFEVTNAVQYKLQVARDTAFTDRIFNAKVSGLSQDFADLAPGKYYWRVKAIEAGGLKSPWSEVRMFTITWIMPPMLDTPLSGAEVSPDVTLAWLEKFDAVQYKIQVSKDAAFTRLIVNEKTPDLYKNLSALKARGYFWRVKAFDAEGNKSPWSEVRQFTVIPPP